MVSARSWQFEKTGVGVGYFDDGVNILHGVATEVGVAIGSNGHCGQVA